VQCKSTVDADYDDDDDDEVHHAINSFSLALHNVSSNKMHTSEYNYFMSSFIKLKLLRNYNIDYQNLSNKSAKTRYLFSSVPARNCRMA